MNEKQVLNIHFIVHIAQILQQERYPEEFELKDKYHISSVIRLSFFLPKQHQRSRSILQDGSRSLGLFWKGKIGIIAKFHWTDLVI